MNHPSVSSIASFDEDFSDCNMSVPSPNSTAAAVNVPLASQEEQRLSLGRNLLEWYTHKIGTQLDQLCLCGSQREMNQVLVDEQNVVLQDTYFQQNATKINDALHSLPQSGTVLFQSNDDDVRRTARPSQRSRRRHGGVEESKDNSDDEGEHRSFSEGLRQAPPLTSTTLVRPRYYRNFLRSKNNTQRGNETSGLEKAFPWQPTLSSQNPPRWFSSTAIEEGLTMMKKDEGDYDDNSMVTKTEYTEATALPSIPLGQPCQTKPIVDASLAVPIRDTGLSSKGEHNEVSLPPIIRLKPRPLEFDCFGNENAAFLNEYYQDLSARPTLDGVFASPSYSKMEQSTEKDMTAGWTTPLCKATPIFEEEEDCIRSSESRYLDKHPALYLSNIVDCYSSSTTVQYPQEHNDNISGHRWNWVPGPPPISPAETYTTVSMSQSYMLDDECNNSILMMPSILSNDDEDVDGDLIEGTEVFEEDGEVNGEEVYNFFTPKCSSSAASLVSECFRQSPIHVERISSQDKSFDANSSSICVKEDISPYRSLLRMRPQNYIHEECYDEEDTLHLNLGCCVSRPLHASSQHQGTVGYLESPPKIHNISTTGRRRTYTPREQAHIGASVEGGSILQTPNKCLILDPSNAQTYAADEADNYDDEEEELLAIHNSNSQFLVQDALSFPELQ